MYSIGVSDEAFEAWGRGEPVAALAAALRAWRSAPAACIADAIDALTDTILAGQAALSAASRDDFHAAWMAEASHGSDAVRTGWLARTLTTRLPIHTHRYGIVRDDYASEKYAALLERVQQLRGHGRDPRIATAFAEVIWRAPYNVGYVRQCAVVYGPILEGLVEQGDARVVERLRMLVRAPRARVASTRRFFADELPAAIEALDRNRVGPPADASRWRALVPEQPVVEPSAGEAELLDAIYEDPDDDEARLVYADMLQTRDDPQGELIALQMMPAAQADATRAKRVKSLVRKHRDAWLGDDLARVLTRVEFERGFLAKAALAQNAVTDDSGWERAARDPRLATLEVLEKGRGNAHWYGLFVMSPATRSLRSIEIPTWGFLQSVTNMERARRLRHLSLPRSPRSKQLDLLAKAPGLAGVDALSIFARDGYERLVEELAASKLSGRLRWLGIQAMWPNEPPVADVLASIDRLPTTLTSLAYLFGAARIELRRESEGLVAFANAHACSIMAEVLPGLSEKVSEVHVDGASERSLEAVQRAAGERPDIALRVTNSPVAAGAAETARHRYR